MPEIALASAHGFKGYIERTGSLQPDKLLKQEIKQGVIYKRLAERFANHNYNLNQQSPGVQIEFFKNLNYGNWNGQEISHTKHLFDYDELDELIDLDKRTNGFQKLQASSVVEFRSKTSLMRKGSTAAKENQKEENPMELLSPKSQAQKSQKSNRSKRA